MHYPKHGAKIELMNGIYRLPIFKRIDGIADAPSACFFPQLDKAYPRSKFILTVRDKESWLQSTRKVIPAQPKVDSKFGWPGWLRVATYGTNAWSEDRLSYVYDRHIREVNHWFQGREEDLLVLDICGGEGWEKLCPFMDKQIPDEPFPRI